jgi:hypothetical protein
VKGCSHEQKGSVGEAEGAAAGDRGTPVDGCPLVLDRRSFAVPRPGRRGDGEIQFDSPSYGLPAGITEVDDLNAAVPEHRGLITLVWLEANNAASPDFFRLEN